MTVDAAEYKTNKTDESCEIEPQQRTGEVVSRYKHSTIVNIKTF